MDWRDYFQDYILDRGYEYYESGKVSDVQITEGCISAVVRGSEKYHVQIDLDGDEIDPDMYCSCPYAEGGHNCKHMAAVLYEVEDRLWPDEDIQIDDDIPSQSTDKTAKPSPSDLVWQADENTVRRFLAAVLNSNEKLALQFEAQLKPAVSAEDIARYEKMLDRTLAQYGDRYGFIDWQEADAFCDEIAEFLSTHVSTLMDHNAYAAAFELSGYAFIKAAECEMDDSSGCLGDLSETISTIWEDLYNTCDEETRWYMFNWCENHLDGSVIDYMEENIEAFYQNCFDEPKFLARKLSFVDKELTRYDSVDKTASDYKLSHLVIYRLELMQNLNLDKATLNAFAERYWKFPEIRKWAAAEREKEGNIEDAIRIYEQGLDLDRDLRGLVRDYAIKLKELYLASGRDDDYLSILWDLELKYQPGNLDIYRELKSRYALEAWVMQRERIYDSLPSYSKAALFLEEGLYDRLLTCCLSSPGITGLREYKNELLKRYPAEVLDRYVNTVEGMAKNTGTRRHYQELVALLREIRKMPGGKEQVVNITGKWREKYRSRPAMMDELKKL